MRSVVHAVSEFFLHLHKKRVLSLSHQVYGHNSNHRNRRHKRNNSLNSSNNGSRARATACILRLRGGFALFLKTRRAFLP